MVPAATRTPIGHLKDGGGPALIHERKPPCKADVVVVGRDRAGTEIGNARIRCPLCWRLRKVGCNRHAGRLLVDPRLYCFYRVELSRSQRHPREHRTNHSDDGQYRRQSGEGDRCVARSRRKSTSRSLDLRVGGRRLPNEDGALVREFVQQPSRIRRRTRLDRLGRNRTLDLVLCRTPHTDWDPSGPFCFA